MSRKVSGLYYDKGRDKPWRARYVDAYKKRKSEWFRTQAEAKEWLNRGRTQADKAKRQLQRGEVPASSVEKKPTLFREYVADWLKRKRPTLAPSTAYRYDQYCEQLKESWIGRIQADELNRDDVGKFMAEYAETYSGNTCLNLLRVLRTLTLDMKAERRLTFWACERVKRPKAVARYTDDEPNMLTREEAKKVLEVMRTNPTLEKWYPMAATIISTGMRFSEAAGLKWKDVDFEKGLIAVRRSVVRREVREDTKTGKVKKPAITGDLEAILKAHRKRSPGLPEAWVFTGRHGEPHYTAALNKPLRKALKLAGINKRVTGHGLRRTLNELGAQTDLSGGTTLRAVTGHSTVDMTEHYRHVPASEKKKLQERATAGILKS